MERLGFKLNHFLKLKRDKGLSLNDQLVAHPDFHAPGITETLVKYLDVDPWASKHFQTAMPSELATQAEAFDYVKVAIEQRATWEASTALSQKVNFVKK